MKVKVRKVSLNSELEQTRKERDKLDLDNQILPQELMEANREFAELRKIRLDELADKAPVLSLEELKALMVENYVGFHIWIRFIDLGAVYAAITDYVDDVGVVAVWCAGNEEDWLREADYGKTWLAYMEKPAEDQRWNTAMPHLNGLEG